MCAGYNFTDMTVTLGLLLSVKQIDNDACSNIPLKHKYPYMQRLLYLYQNYPNPFNPTTTIEFTVPDKEKVTLSSIIILGQSLHDF